MRLLPDTAGSMLRTRIITHGFSTTDMKKFTTLSTWLAVLALALVLAGCQDLLVENEEDPDVEDVLANPQDAQTLIASTWAEFWIRTQNNSTIFEELPMIADEGTSGNSRYNDAATLPRVQYPNNYSLSSRFISQSPWYGWYEMAENAAAAINAIENNGLRIVIADDDEEEATDKTARARAFAYFAHGLAYSYVANIWDKASTLSITADRDAPESFAYRPYTEVLDFALDSFDRAIVLSQSSDAFVTPPSWMGGITVDNDQLARMARSYAARAIVYNARTPQERQDLDWGRVLSYLDGGVIQEDIAPTISDDGIRSLYAAYAQLRISDANKADYKLIGPGDTSGEYATWFAASPTEKDTFLIDTPDRRITGDGGPTSDGLYFRYRPVRYSSQTPGYLQGTYQWSREGGRYQSGTKRILTVEEMDLIRAEALIRGANPDLDQAAALINNSRVGNGQLDPVTASGVPGDINSCVPRTMDGQACGNLLDALHYERMIEGAYADAYRAWFDRRGFGTLAEGTYYHLPIPVRELQAFDQPFYTFGGAGNDGAADASELVE